jgi:hypothetical protein
VMGRHGKRVIPVAARLADSTNASLRATNRS